MYEFPCNLITDRGLQNRLIVYTKIRIKPENSSSSSKSEKPLAFWLETKKTTAKNRKTWKPQKLPKQKNRIYFMQKSKTRSEK